MNSRISKLEHWNSIFRIKKEFYIDGYSLFFEEQNVYPRLISVHKIFENQEFSIYSYQRIFDVKNGKEKLNEIYSIERIKDIDEMLKKLKEIFCGTDLLMQASSIYNKLLKSC